MKRTWVFIISLLILAVPAVRAQFLYITNNGAIVITGFTGTGVAMIPDSIDGLPVTTIAGEALLAATNVTSVFIPAGITVIGDQALAGCPNLSVITVAPENPFYSSQDGVLFDKNETALIRYPGGLTGDYTIPSGVTTIKDFAFQGCSGLTSVTIPNGVTGLEIDAFDLCTNLARVVIPATVTDIGESAFAHCYSLTNITIPASVSTIEDHAFAECNNLCNAWFLGDAPAASATVFANDLKATAYYLLEADGWGPTLGGIPTAPWVPQIQTGGGSLGVVNDQFGFNIAWVAGKSVVVEACTNLANPSWQPLQTITLTNEVGYFGDPQWQDSPVRLYRVLGITIPL